MRKLIFLIFGLFVVLILALVIIPFLIPSSVYKSAVQEQLSERLARNVDIKGDVKISPLPSLKVKVGAVDIENPDGFSSDYFAQIEGLEVRVKLLPLLSKRVEISAFELIKPVIKLERLSDGTANWALGQNSGEIERAEEGPFKRDGRFKDLKASLGTFIIRSGSVDYSDAVTNRNHKLTDVNLELSMPSMNDTLTADGNLILDRVPADIMISLETPRRFLDGKKTPVDLTLGTLFGDLKAKGYFTESEDIHFAFDVIGSVKDLTPLNRFLPTKTSYSELADSINFSGNYAYDGQKIDAKNADIKISGPAISSHFKGDAIVSDNFRGNGRIEIDIQDYGKLTQILELDTPFNDVLQKATITSDIKLDGETVLAENLKTRVLGKGLDADFNGQARFGEKIALKGRFNSKIASIPELAKLFDFDHPQLMALGNGEASGMITYDGASTVIKLDKAQTDGPNLTASYLGDIKLSENTVSLEGKFVSEAPDISRLSQAAQMELPYSNVVGTVKASGMISGSPEDLIIKDVDLALDDGDVNGTYVGSAAYNATSGLSLDGAFTGVIPELSRLAKATGQDLPYAKSINRVETTGKVKGRTGGFNFEGLTIDLSDGELNGEFNGNAHVKDGFKLDGLLNAEIPSARSLTRTTTGVELPPSTEAGQIYERVALSGKVSGNPAGLRFSNAGLSMDAIDGDGEFELDLTTKKPTLKGTLDMGQIDFRPYMAAYSAGVEGIQPWSEEPYNFSALKLMDGKYIIKTPEVIFGPLTFGQTDLDAVVTDGVMTARLPEVNLYGGLGIMTATLDASSEIPKVKLAVTLEDITSNRFLSALANFTKLEGTGHTLLEITGEGRSQAEIMRSLNGYGDFEVIGGVIKGIDLSKFLTGVDESLTQRVLPQGIGETYATNFNDLVGKFKIKDGVISLDSFNLKAAGVHAGGSGILDIGNQKLDFGLRPRLTNADASDLGRFGIPIRFKGPWGNISPGPDFDLMQKIAIEKAKVRAREEITDRVGGEVGSVLGGLLGVPNEGEKEIPETETDTESETKANTATENEQPVSESTEPLLDAPTQTTTESEQESVDLTEPEAEKPLEEQLLEDALGSLFGGKKDTPKE